MLHKRLSHCYKIYYARVNTEYIMRDSKTILTTEQMRVGFAHRRLREILLLYKSFFYHMNSVLGQLRERGIAISNRYITLLPVKLHDSRSSNSNPNSLWIFISLTQLIHYAKNVFLMSFKKSASFHSNNDIPTGLVPSSRANSCGSS